MSHEISQFSGVNITNFTRETFNATKEVIHDVTPRIQLEPKIIAGILVLLFFAVIYVIITLIVKKYVGKDETRKGWNTFLVFLRIFLLFIGLAFVLTTFSGNLAAIGLTAGLLGVWLGIALQKPIVGTFVWLLLIIKKPFKIGDYIAVGNFKGEVDGITTSHVHIKEYSGGDEKTGREILIPINKVVEENLVVYKEGLIHDEVSVNITQKSNLQKAKKIMQEVASGVLNIREKDVKTTVNLQKGSIVIDLHYEVNIKRKDEISSSIKEAIFSRFLKERDVDLV